MLLAPVFTLLFFSFLPQWLLWKGLQWIIQTDLMIYICGLCFIHQMSPLTHLSPFPELRPPPHTKTQYDNGIKQCCISHIAALSLELESWRSDHQNRHMDTTVCTWTITKPCRGLVAVSNCRPQTPEAHHDFHWATHRSALWGHNSIWALYNALSAKQPNSQNHTLTFMI